MSVFQSQARRFFQPRVLPGRCRSPRKGRRPLLPPLELRGPLRAESDAADAPGRVVKAVGVPLGGPSVPVSTHTCLPLSGTPCSSLNPTITPQGDGSQPGPTGQAGERGARRSKAEEALERTRKGGARAGSAGRSGTARTALGCEERRPREAEILASPTRRSTTRRESTSRARRCGKDGARTRVRACAAESRSPKTSRS